VPAGAPPRVPGRPGGPPRPSPQPTVSLPPPREPWYRRLAASPRYLALAIAGVLIVGGGAAFGVVQLVDGDEGGAATPQAGDGGEAAVRENREARGGAPINPANVTVAVLNGTTVPGLASSIGDRVTQLGFQLGTVANGPEQDQQRAESVVMYTPGSAREAAVVSRRLRIPQRERADAASRALAGNATVIVIAGADRTQ
jgi:LytR cell envelope-related transcriptional attenuator